MSRFKRIKNKTTKKSSVSIDEKISALNKELEKTGMLSEKMTTDNVLSTSEYVPPQEYKEGEVPNHSGIGGEGFSQNSAGSGVAGDPPNHSDMSDLYNSDVGHPIYKSTSYGGVGSFGIVIGPSFGAGTSYGIIENGNIYRQVLGAFLAGGTRGPGNYESVYRNYLQVNEHSPGFYSQEQIDQALENWQLAIQVHAALVEIGFDNSRFNVPWKAWRKAILFEDLSSQPSYAHPEKGTIYLVQFNLLGMPNTYAEQDARPPGTTNPQRRGLEDDPIFPGPIANLFKLGQRAFDYLKDKAEAAAKRFDGIGAILDAVPPFLNFLAHQINPFSPWTEENPFPVNINNEEKKNIKNDIEELFNEWGPNRVEELNNGDPMTANEMNQLNKKINSNKPDASDDNLVGDIFDAKYNSARMTLNNVGNPKAFAGNIKKKKDGSYTPTAIEDNYVFEGDMDASAPGAPKIIKTLIDNGIVQNAIKNSGLDYPYRKDAANEPGVETEITTKDGKKIKINQKEYILNKNMPIKFNLQPNINFGMYGNIPLPESLDESVALGLYEPEAMNVNLADIRKGVMPEYPKKPPAEMIDGYHEKSPLRPKPLDNEPYVKITKADLIRNHRLNPSEANEMMNTINMINDYIRDNPADLIHAQMRYPKDDPRLAELNWKMDQMLEAGDRYMDSNFKENKKLYKRAMDRTKNNIKLTDPEYVQQKYDELRGTPKPKKTKLVGRLGKYLNKYESKSLFKHVNSKDFKKISERKLEKEKFLEKQEQERLDYINDINAEMDEFRSDWRNELKEQPVFKAVPIDTGKMTSSQSFAVFPNFPGSSDTGIRLDLDGGLGRDNSLANTDAGLEDPNFTGIFQFPTEAGGFVPAINFRAGGEINSAQINYGDFPLSGYAMPLGGDMYRSITQRKKEEINKELDSSEEYTKQIKADALMKARVEDGPTVVKIYKASDFTPGEGLADRYPPEQLQKLSVQNPQKFSEYKHIFDIADEMTKKVETSFEKIDQEYSDQWEPKLSSLLPSNQYSDLYKKHGGSAFSEVNIEINRLYNEEQKAMTRVKTKDGIRLRSNKKSRAIRATANKISDAIPTLQELQNKLDDIRQSKMDVVEAENRRETKALQKAAPEFFFPHGELKPLDLYMEPFGADLKTMSDIEKYAPEPTTKSMTGNEVNNLDNKQINTAVKDVGSSFGPNIGTGFKIFGDFLTKGYNDRFVADRKYLGKEYMNRQFFPNVSFDRDGTYVKKDVVVGSGQPAKYNENTGMIEIRATFDFKTNAQEVASAIASEKGEKADWASRFNRTGSKYALDAIVDPLPGVLKPLSGMIASHLISTAKFVGKGNLIPIVIKITPEELKLKNKKAYNQLVELGVIPKDK